MKPVMTENYQLFHGDCLEVMKQIPNGSVDMILCDLPYAVTGLKWDVRIDFDCLWEEYLRVIKENGAIVLFGTEPFSSLLRTSNIGWYKYDWIWEKDKASNFMLSKKQPMRYTENISVFYAKQPTYNPQMWKGNKNHSKGKLINRVNKGYLEGVKVVETNTESDLKYPKNIIKTKRINPKEVVHPTQKPVELLEYLIKTYTNEGELVLDNCMGSGSTGVACINTGRNFIGIELDDNYFDIAKNRIAETPIHKTSEENKEV